MRKSQKKRQNNNKNKTKPNWQHWPIQIGPAANHMPSRGHTPFLSKIPREEFFFQKPELWNSFLGLRSVRNMQTHTWMESAFSALSNPIINLKYFFCWSLLLSSSKMFCILKEPIHIPSINSHFSVPFYSSPIASPAGIQSNLNIRPVFKK